MYSLLAHYNSYSLPSRNPAGHHVIIKSTLQNLSKKPAAMLSLKVCLDMSTYTDSSQQYYWSQSQFAMFLLNYSQGPVYFTTPSLCLNPYMVWRCWTNESYSSLRTIRQGEERRGVTGFILIRRTRVSSLSGLNCSNLSMAEWHTHTHTHTNRVEGSLGCRLFGSLGYKYCFSGLGLWFPCHRFRSEERGQPHQQQHT